MKSWLIRIIWISAVLIGWVSRDQFVEVVVKISELDLTTKIIVYTVLYITLAGLAVPGAVFLTTLAGPLFGIGWGTGIASMTSTCGATLAFLSSRRFLFCDPKNVEEDVSKGISSQFGPWELFLLRLTPVVPFFAVNLLAGRSRVTAPQFWVVSQIGMLPATYLLVRLGAILTMGQTTTIPGRLLAASYPVLLLGLLGWGLRIFGKRKANVSRYSVHL